MATIDFFNSPHAPALYRQAAHQLKRIDPVAAEELLAKARAADEALSAARVIEIREACLKAALANGLTEATAEMVQAIDEGRASGEISLKAIKNNAVKKFIFEYLEQPRV